MATTPNFLDLALLVLLAFFFVRALVRGFVREAMGLVGVVVAVVVSALTYEDLGRFLTRVSGTGGEWWPAVAFGGVVILVFAAFLYLGAALSRLVLSGPLSGFDRMLGGAFGLAKGILVAYLVVNLLLLFMPLQAPASLKSSMMAPYIVRAGRLVVDLLPDDIMAQLQKRAGLLPDDDPLSALGVGKGAGKAHAR